MSDNSRLIRSTRPLSICMAAGAASASAVVGERGNVGVLGFEMAQHVLQAFFDPSEIAGAVVRRRFEAFEQIRYALFEMREGGRAVIADLQMVEAVHQRPQGAFDMFRIVADHGPFAAFQRRCQRRDALFEHRERIAAAFGAGELVDLGRQRVDVFAEPRQGVGGCDVGDDRPQCRDGVFKLTDGAGIVAAAHDHVELGAEIADRFVVAGELFGRRHRAQRFANFVQRAFDIGQNLVIDSTLPRIVDAPRQRADFILDRFDRAARHRLGDGVADFVQLAAERGDRLLDIVGTLQRFDLAGDLEQMLFEPGEIRTGRRRRRHRRGDRRRAARRHRPRLRNCQVRSGAQ